MEVDGNEFGSQRFSNYESMDKQSMDNVRKFIQEFVDANGLNLHKEEN